MKIIINIILLLAISFQALNKLCIVASFEMNRQYIAAILCENRLKPEKKCNGKCQLAKKLDNDQKREETPTVKKTEPFWAICPAAIPSQYPFFSTRAFQNTFHIPRAFFLHRSIFHPPNV